MSLKWNFYVRFNHGEADSIQFVDDSQHSIKLVKDRQWFHFLSLHRLQFSIRRCSIKDYIISQLTAPEKKKLAQ